MDFINEAEKVLWHYRDMKKSLDYQNREIEKLEKNGAPRDIGAIQYSDMPKAHGQQEETYNLCVKLQTYIKMRNITKEEMKGVDEILEDIDEGGCEGYRKLLELWYVEGWQKDIIASQLNYSKRTLYDMKAKAIKKFAVRLFGYSAVKAI